MPRTGAIRAGPGGLAAEPLDEEARRLYPRRPVADCTRTRIALTDYNENLPIGDQLYEAVASRNGSHDGRAWTQRTLSEGGRAPMTVRTTGERITVLCADARTVGFVGLDELTPDLVVVENSDLGD